MTEKLNTKMVTPVVPCSYPHLQEMSEDASGNMCYSVQVLLPADDKAVMKQLKQVMENAAMNKWGKSINDIGAIHYVDDGKADDEIQAGMKRFSAKSFSRRPQCVWLNLEPIPVEQISEVIYPGCKVRYSISAYATDKGGRPTVAFGLNNVMFVDDGDRIGGAAPAASDFDAFKDDSYQPDHFGEKRNDEPKSGDDGPEQGDLF